MLIFEAAIVFHDEWVIKAPQKIFFLSDVFKEGMFFNLLFAVTLEDVQLLLLNFVSAADKKNGSEFSLFKLLKHHKLV